MRVNLSGQKFNKITVVSYSHTNKHQKAVPCLHFKEVWKKTCGHLF